MTRGTEEIREIVENLGYKLLNEYFKENSSLRRVIVQDEEGYKYDINFDNFMRGHVPKFVDVNNPFTVSHNIPLWLKINNKPFILCENNTYKGSDKKLFFKCMKESCSEIFDMSWKHVYGESCGCPFCRGYRVGKSNNLSYLRPHLVSEWDYKKNKYNPEDYTVGSGEMVSWICSKCGYKWESIISNRSKGSGCPKCNQPRGEKRILSWLIQNKDKLINLDIINSQQQKTFLNCKNKQMLPFDFGLEKNNGQWILIEFHGEQHYHTVDFFGGEEKFKTQKKNDKIKEKYCKDNNIQLLIIPYWNFDKIEEILENYFFNM